jgi:hypothetical protein
MPFSYYDRLSPERKRTYARSDAIETLSLPPGEDLAPLAAAIASGLEGDRRLEVERACQRLLDALTGRFGVPPLQAKVYAVRPSGDWGELHGMYRPQEEGARAVVELWMRTARQRKVVAPRTFLRTLVHELCHHLDYELLGLAETLHTEGFYKRESHLLNQLAGSPAPRGTRTAVAPSPAADPPTTETGTRGASAQSSS